MTIRSGILGWINRALPDTPAIWQNQNGPIPERIFVAIRITTIRREGHANVGAINAGGFSLIQHGALVTTEVDVFGGAVGQAEDVANTLRGSLERVTMQDALRADGLAFARIAREPVDLSALIGTEWESRASFDAQFRTNILDVEDVGWIEKVEVTGRVVSATVQLT